MYDRYIVLYVKPLSPSFPFSLSLSLKAKKLYNEKWKMCEDARQKFQDVDNRYIIIQ